MTLGYPGEPLWWELASLVTIMLLGNWIEMRSIAQASGALRELARLLPSTAQRIVGETIEDIEISALREATSCWCDRATACRQTASCRAARAT